MKGKKGRKKWPLNSVAGDVSRSSNRAYFQNSNPGAAKWPSCLGIFDAGDDYFSVNAGCFDLRRSF
jgi:hypothetical protein